MKNILVAIDFANRSNQLLYKAIEMGKAFNAKLWFLHVTAPNADFINSRSKYIQNIKAKELKGEHKILKNYSEEATENGLASESLLIQGPILHRILEEIKKLKIDTVIIGHHNHSFLYSLFTEDTSIELLKKSSVPLYIIPLD